MEQGRMVDPGEVDPDPYPNLTFNGKTTGVNPDLTVKKKLGSGFNHRKTLGSDRIGSGSSTLITTKPYSKEPKYLLMV